MSVPPTLFARSCFKVLSRTGPLCAVPATTVAELIATSCARGTSRESPSEWDDGVEEDEDEDDEEDIVKQI